MRKSTIRILAEIDALTNLVKESKTELMKKYLSENIEFIEWVESFELNDEHVIKNDLNAIIEKSYEQDTAEVIIFNLLRDKIILNLKYLENSTDQGIDKQIVQKMKETLTKKRS